MISRSIILKPFKSQHIPLDEVHRVHGREIERARRDFLRELKQHVKDELLMTCRNANDYMALLDCHFIHCLTLGGLPVRENLVAMPIKYHGIAHVFTDAQKLAIQPFSYGEVLVPTPDPETLIWEPRAPIPLRSEAMIAYLRDGCRACLGC